MTASQGSKSLLKRSGVDNGGAVSRQRWAESAARTLGKGLVSQDNGLGGRPREAHKMAGPKGGGGASRPKVLQRLAPSVLRGQHERVHRIVAAPKGRGKGNVPTRVVVLGGGLQKAGEKWTEGWWLQKGKQVACVRPTAAALVATPRGQSTNGGQVNSAGSSWYVLFVSRIHRVTKRVQIRVRSSQRCAALRAGQRQAGSPGGVSGQHMRCTTHAAMAAESCDAAQRRGGASGVNRG